LQSGGAIGSSAHATSQSSAPAASVNDFISKTKRQNRKGLKPSGPELIAYARYLGIDPVADHDLLWIAVEALEAPLPSTWSEHFDSNDRVFYYNASTRVSSWTHPLEHVYRETYSTIVNFRNSNLSPPERAEQLQKLQAECEQMEKDVHREISLWTEHHDEHGHRFYFNSQDKQSTWTDPRPAQCHILYLKMKLVRVLSSCAGVAGAVAVANAAAAASASNLGQCGEGPSSRFAPPLSNTSPRREQGGAVASDFGGKRAKVGGGGVEPIDQFPRKGANDPTGSARGSGGMCTESEGELIDAGMMPAHDGDGFADTEAEGDRHHKERRKKKKDKKKRHHDTSGDDEGHHHRKDAEHEASSMRAGGGPNLNQSQSEPSIMGKAAREAAPPPTGTDEVCGMGGGPYPAVPHSLKESGGLSQVGRTKIQAGIRLQPLQTTGGVPSGSVGEVSTGLHLSASSSVPELKPLGGLRPLGEA
jgi:hypothetical protein